MAVKARLAVAAAVTLVVAGCQKTEPPVATAIQLDESQLIQAERFLPSDVDPAVSACTDLDTHANAKWLAANPIPADQVWWGTFRVLGERSLQVRKQIAEQLAAQPAQTGVRKIIADFWATGMDEQKLQTEGIKPLASQLAAIEALTDGASVAGYLRQQAAVGVFPVFDFSPDTDFKDSTRNILYVTQSGLSLPDKTDYFDKGRADIREAFLKHIGKVLELSGLPAEAAAAQAKDVMAFETRLAGASLSQEQIQGDVSLWYNPITPAAADALTPNFSWTKFIESQHLAVPAQLSFAMPDFHAEVSRMLAEVPVAQWQSFLRFHLVDEASAYLSDAFADARFEFYGKALQGQQAQKPRWQRVLAALEESAGETMGQEYVKVAYPPESQAQMQAMVANFLAALKARIENLTWMTEATKQKALAKWAGFGSKIGYPGKWRDWTGLATSADSYYGNVMAAQAFNYRWQLGKADKPVDRTEWHMTPQTVNAYYSPQQNEIVFPAAILQPPFFDPKADDAYNYGALGGLIGHELMHGFDDQGSRFGPTGNFEQWWTPTDEKQFKALTDKLVKQFDAYRVGPEKLKVNGNLTLGENIADLGGLYVAYDALVKATEGKPDTLVDGFTRDQRFFYGWAAGWRTSMRPELIKTLAAADPHAPDSTRTIGAPSNHPAYAAAFGCQDGDPMVRSGEKRVVIW